MESGPLAFAFSDGESVLTNRGLVEALSIQVPEREGFGGEFIDALPECAPRDRVLSATISALPWRDPSLVTVRTRDVVFEGLTKRGMSDETFDNLFAIACQETSLDAFWLHQIFLIHDPADFVYIILGKDWPHRGPCRDSSYAT
jgi:hypothetical protein